MFGGAELKHFNKKQVPRLKNKEKKKNQTSINKRKGWLLLGAYVFSSKLDADKRAYFPS